jgi:RHS repeat-associated protein
VITSASGTIEELIDYYPFGAIRFDEKASAFGEKKKFTGHTFDVDTGLSFMQARYQDGNIGRFISIDPASLNYPKKLLNDPQKFNSYSYVRNNPFTYLDPNGEEPTKAQAGTISSFIKLMNTSPSKAGQYKGQAAGNYLSKAGSTSFNWSHFRPEPNETYYNTLSTRYIYTEKGGWVDMSHFMFYAGTAYQFKLDGENDPVGKAIQDGYRQEFSDRFTAKQSAYSYEDLPSDKYGADFATNYFNPNSKLTLSEQINNYFTNVLKATDPSKAPNFWTMPEKDSKNPPSKTNHTTKPVDLKVTIRSNN